MLHQMHKIIQLENVITSLLKLLLWIILDKFKLATVQLWIVILHILPANSKKSSVKLIEELEKLLKNNLKLSNKVILLLLLSNLRNLCVSKNSKNSHHLVDLLLEIWNKPLLWESSKKLTKSSNDSIDSWYIYAYINIH